jgi:hypothetical protein
MTHEADINAKADPSLEAVPFERVAVLKLTIPPGERRTPVAVAHVLVARMIVTFSVHGRAKGPLVVRGPTGADARDGVILFPEAAKMVTALVQRAVEADPVILAHLRKPAPSRAKGAGGKRRGDGGAADAAP